jgi:glycosyltransferase involved in cell wall biosynthesis
MENGPPRIAFHGYVFSYTGFGTASRAYIHAFHDASIETTVVDRAASHPRHVPDALVAGYVNKFADPVLHVTNAEAHDIEPLKNLFSRLIVLTTWEADTLPPRFVESLNRVLEVWVPSRYNLEVFQRQLKTPVFQMPHPVYGSCAPCFTRAEIDKQLGWSEDSFVFVANGTWQERKNLPGVIEAFLRAFPDEPNAVLFIKTLYTFTNERLVHAQISEAVERVGPAQAQKAIARIKICAEFWPEACVAAMAQRADCFVSLHRGEGWCYPLFDAACNATPVIATGYSGPMDYLDAQHHRLVGYELTAANQQEHAANFAFTSEMRWAEPDVAHAAALMREVFDGREHAREKAAAGAAELRRRYSPEAVGQMARQRLTELAKKVGQQG